MFPFSTVISCIATWILFSYACKICDCMCSSSSSHRHSLPLKIFSHFLSENTAVQAANFLEPSINCAVHMEILTEALSPQTRHNTVSPSNSENGKKLFSSECSRKNPNPHSIFLLVEDGVCTPPPWISVPQNGPPRFDFIVFQHRFQKQTHTHAKRIPRQFFQPKHNGIHFRKTTKRRRFTTRQPQYLQLKSVSSFWSNFDHSEMTKTFLAASPSWVNRNCKGFCIK